MKEVVRLRVVARNPKNLSFTIPVPVRLIKAGGFKEGDHLVLTLNPDNTITITLDE